MSFTVDQTSQSFRQEHGKQSKRPYISVFRAESGRYVTFSCNNIANEYGHVLLRVLSTSFPLKRSHTMPVKAAEVSAN